MFARDLTPPYYAVIFANKLGDAAGYAEVASEMDRLARSQPGYLGTETSRSAEGFGITVSYWTDEAAILGWKRHARHAAAQNEGIRRFYEHYELRVARVERAYSGPSGRTLIEEGNEHV